MPRALPSLLLGQKIKQKGGDKECLKKEKDSL
jgi:hypothetical protein